MANTMEFMGISSQQVQTSGTFLFYILIGFIVVAIIGYIIFLIIRNAQFKIGATIFEEVGDQTIKIDDVVRVIKIDDAEMLYFKNLKLYAPRFHPKYFTINKYWSGGVKIRQSLTLLKKGDKIVPVIVNPDASVQAYDYDAWNYLVQRLRINQAKYEKNQQLMRILPFIALGAVILMFILGNLFWGMHIEKVARMILESAATAGESLLKSKGAIQVMN